MSGCGKIRYRDKLAAMIAMASVEGAANKGNAKRDEKRIYRCPDCRGWHLTSQPKRKRNRSALGEHEPS